MRTLNALLAHVVDELVDHHIDRRVWGVLTGKYLLKVVASGSTPAHRAPAGFWSYENGVMGGINRIHINLDMLAPGEDCPFTNEAVSPDHIVDLATAIYDHEAAHSLYTERDNKAVAKAVKDAGIEFSILNLFEDARIEKRWSDNVFRPGETFGWKNYLKSLPEDQRENLMASDREGAKALYRFTECVANEAHATGFNSDDPEIDEFYRRAVEAASTLDLIPIVREFQDRYPDAKNYGNNGGLDQKPAGSDMQMQIAFAVENDPALKDDGDEGAAAAREISGGAAKWDGEEWDPESEGFGHGRVAGVPKPDFRDIDTRLRDYEVQCAQRLANYLAPAFRKPGVARIASMSPSNRLNVKNIIRCGGTRPFKRNANAEIGRPHVSIIVDCSGSMSANVSNTNRLTTITERLKEAGIATTTGNVRAYTPIEGLLRVDVNARIFVRALNILAKSNKLTADVYLSAEGGCYRKFSLPDANEEINIREIHGWSGSEGLEQTIRKNMPAIRKTKLALVFTDGKITDLPINRKAVHANGVYTIGLYAGDVDYDKALKEHFDTSISRKDLFGMADSLVKFLQQH